MPWRTARVSRLVVSPLPFAFSFVHIPPCCFVLCQSFPLMSLFVFPCPSSFFNLPIVLPQIRHSSHRFLDGHVIWRRADFDWDRFVRLPLRCLSRRIHCLGLLHHLWWFVFISIKFHRGPALSTGSTNGQHALTRDTGSSSNCAPFVCHSQARGTKVALAQHSLSKR